MDITSEVLNSIGKPESKQLEYKSVLPPSKAIARLISAFSNTEGGLIILGVSDNLDVKGLSSDFHATSVVRKAIDLLTPIPEVYYQYVSYNGKNLFAIKAVKSDKPILLEKKAFQRIGSQTQSEFTPQGKLKDGGYQRIKDIDQRLQQYLRTATTAKSKFVEHYQSILRLVDRLDDILYAKGAQFPTDNPDGKVLTRILFSSLADNFETYLSELLFEIFLANPNTLKSNESATLIEILNCADIQEFIEYWANKKLKKLQKGSVKGFLNENKQIADLKVIDKTRQKEIEKMLQIRHLYSHRNGIVDEKFLEYFRGSYTKNTEHQLSIDQFLDYFCYLAKVVDEIDKKASDKHSLST